MINEKQYVDMRKDLVKRMIKYYILSIATFAVCLVMIAFGWDRPSASEACAGVGFIGGCFLGKGLMLRDEISNLDLYKRVHL